jgi:putative glutamine amidotransferase
MLGPVAGVMANAHLLEDRFPVQLAGDRNLCALAKVADALSWIFASAADTSISAPYWMGVDGVLRTGARANIRLGRFGTERHPAHQPYDDGSGAPAPPGAWRFSAFVAAFKR